jgi:hypothetical protein
LIIHKGYAVDSDPVSPALVKELAELEYVCWRAAQNIADAISVREAVEVAEVEVPHHLQAIAYSAVPTLSQLGRMRDQRVEELVKKQLSSLSLERNYLVAAREFDRIKATDWHILRVNYPDLYATSLRDANLIMERKSRR